MIGTTGKGRARTQATAIVTGSSPASRASAT